MIWYLIARLFSACLTLFRLRWTTDVDKDLEILILRQQLSILERKQQKALKPDRAEKLALAVLAARLKQQTQRPISKFQDLIRLFQPETVFSWHRALGAAEMDLQE